jgi:hypothetical protein
MSTPSLKPIDRREVVRVENQEGHQRRQRIVENRAGERRQMVARLTNLMLILITALEGLIGFRVALKLMAANPANAFASFIYRVSYGFVAPFLNLTISPAAEGIVLEVPSLIAMAVYAFVGWLIIRLTWVLLYRRGTRTVETYETE